MLHRGPPVYGKLIFLSLLKVGISQCPIDNQLPSFFRHVAKPLSLQSIGKFFVFKRRIREPCLDKIARAGRKEPNKFFVPKPFFSPTTKHTPITVSVSRDCDPNSQIALCPKFFKKLFIGSDGRQRQIDDRIAASFQN